MAQQAKIRVLPVWVEWAWNVMTWILLLSLGWFGVRGAWLLLMLVLADWAVNR